MLEVKIRETGWGIIQIEVIIETMRLDKVCVKEKEGNCGSCHYSLLLKTQELTLVTLNETQEMGKINFFCISWGYMFLLLN